MENEQASALLDDIDGLEALLLEFDERLRKGEDERALVHVLFRKAHNLKGACAVAGLEEAVALVHEAESCLDALRSSGARAERSLADLLVAAVDELRRAIASSSEDAPAPVDNSLAGSLAREAERLKSGARTERGIDFALTATELSTLETRSLAGEAIWLLEKLVGPAVDESALGELPIFSTIAELGAVVAFRLKRAEEGGEAVLSLLFATAMPAEELAFTVFDPLFPIAAAQAMKANPKSQVESVPPRQREKDRGPAVGEAEFKEGTLGGISSALPRILVVDDEALALLLLQKVLGSYGRIDTASCGNEALARFTNALSEAPYDVVFLDIMMEDLTGTEVLRELRRLEREAKVADGEGARVVMSSALDDFGTVSLAFREQCEAYLIKPVDPVKIREAMAKIGYKPLV